MRSGISESCPTRPQRAPAGTSSLLAHGFDHGIEIGELARCLLGVNLLPIYGEFKHAAARRNEFQRANTLFELQQFFRQTDGLRLIVSSRAVFDCDLHGHNIACRRKIRREPITRQAVHRCAGPFKLTPIRKLASWLQKLPNSPSFLSRTRASFALLPVLRPAFVCCSTQFEGDYSR